jgi:DNA-binding NarL/FixJ family response regulator
MCASHNITVVVIDRHWMVADGLAQRLSREQDIEVVGVSTRIREGLELVTRAQPDVVIIDEALPDGNGFEATRKIASTLAKSKVLILAASKNHDVVTQALRVGSAGVLSRERPCQDVIDAVRTVSQNRSILAPEDFAGLVDGWLPKSPKRAIALTARELEVLRLLAGARSSKEIARDLDVSVHTVKNHSYNIFLKLGAHSRIEAIAKAIHDGILEPGDIGVSRSLAVA